MRRNFKNITGLSPVLNTKRIGTPRIIRINLFSYLCLSVFICGSLPGCRPKEIASHQAIGYVGPIEPIQDVVNRINENNEQIPTLRGKGSFEALIKDPNADPNEKPQFVNGDLTLLYSRPRSIRIIAEKPALRLFEIAGNDDRYWVILHTQGTMQWGSYKNLNNVDINRVPIRPDLVLEVLGILPVDSNLMQAPVPSLRFNSDYDMYMIVWSAPTQSHWAAVKEIWYDRKTKLPMMVILFDDTGRVILRAKLSEHRPVEVAGTAPESSPKVATRYDLLFPLNGSKFSFDLKDDLSLSRGGAPNARTFMFPDANNAGVSHIISLDEEHAR